MSQRKCLCDSYLRGRELTVERDRCAHFAPFRHSVISKALALRLGSLKDSGLRCWRVWRGHYETALPHCDIWVSSLPTSSPGEADAVLFCLYHDQQRMGFRSDHGGFTHPGFVSVHSGIHSEENDFC